MRYVIVGGGIAGVSAAEEIRRHDAQGEITLIDAESFPLYSRVLLPHFIKGKIDRSKVFLKKEEWYAQNNIDWQPGITVSQVDAKNKFVRTSEERELPFDKLLIVTGGEVRLLDTDLRGVSYFRTLADADLMLDLLRGVKRRPEVERRGVVFGGGFIAFEYINLFAHFLIPTTVVMRSGGFFSRVLSPATQNILQSHVVAHGVDLRINESIKSLTGEIEITGVNLESGEHLPCAMLGVGIGIAPDLSWLRDSGLELGHGLKANEFLETNLPDVYTAGDCAEFFDPIVQRRYQVGNWMSAVMQGRAAGRAMIGKRESFQLVSSYATNVLGKEIVMIGDVSREHAQVVQLHLDDQNAIEIFNRQGQTVGAALIGETKARQAITNAIKNRTEFTA